MTEPASDPPSPPRRRYGVELALVMAATGLVATLAAGWPTWPLGFAQGVSAAIALSAAGLLAFRLAGRPGADQTRAWVMLTIGASTTGAHTILNLGSALGLHTASATGAAVAAVVIGLLITTGTWRVARTGHTTPAAVMQAMIDGSLILGSVFALLHTAPDASNNLAWAARLPDLVTVLIEVGILLTLGLMALSGSGSLRHTTSLLLIAGGASRLMGVGLLLVWDDPGVGQWATLSVGLDALGWSSMALAGSTAAARITAPAERIPPMRWPNELLPRMVTLVVVGLVAIWGAGHTALALLSAGLAARETFLHAYLRDHWRHERRRWARLVMDARAERDEAQATLDDLARLVHDQAAPITALWATLERVGSPERGAFWQQLTLHLEHLHTLTSRLHARLRGQAAAPPRRVRVNVAHERDVVLEGFATQAARAGVSLEAHPGTDETDVVGDPIAIRRILENLISNALRATPRGGCVMVELWDDRKTPAGLTISVRDTGSGIDPAQQADLRAQRTKRGSGSGLGLGLMIVRELTEAMGGSYGIESKPGGGSHVWVRLPSVDDRAQGAAPSPQPRRSNP